MPSILLPYGAGEGQTRKVATQIAGVLAARGHDVEAVEVGDPPDGIDVADVDAVLVGGCLQAGAHQPSIRRFVEWNADALAGRPSGFFQVSTYSGVLDAEGRERARAFADRLFEATGWYPDLLGVFGGALLYSKYGFFERHLVRWRAGRTTGDVDTSRDYEYTDWDAVERFAGDFATFVERELDVEPPVAAGDAVEVPGQDDPDIEAVPPEPPLEASAEEPVVDGGTA